MLQNGPKQGLKLSVVLGWPPMFTRLAWRQWPGVDNSLAFNQQMILLEKKRAVLLGLLRLTEALEQLRGALQAVLQLGAGGHAQLSLADLRSFEKIRERVASLSVAELQSGIHNLDQRVRHSLADISQLALHLVDDAQASLADLERINPRLNEFNRFARTTIAMRALLARRGLSLAPLQLELPRSEIEQRLAGVEQKEQSICQALVRHIGDMRGDLALILGNPACAESQRQFYSELDQALAANLAHIEAGLSLSDLPMPIESIEVADQVDTAAAPEPATAVEAAPRLAASVLPTSTSPLVGTSPGAESGFVSRFKTWLNSPWDVRWKDVPKTLPGKTKGPADKQ